MKKYMGRDKSTNKHTNRHFNTMNRPGLRVGSIEKKVVMRNAYYIYISIFEEKYCDNKLFCVVKVKVPKTHILTNLKLSLASNVPFHKSLLQILDKTES